VADRLGAPHIEMDSLFHLPGWQERPREDFLRLVAEATAGESWVIDGNYSAAGELLTSRIDTIVWLDYPFPLVFSRLLRRTAHRILTKQEVCNGNRETLWLALRSDSILWWAIKTHRRRRHQCDEFLSAPQNADKTKLRFRHPLEPVRWLESLEPRAPGLGAR
jgi:adenylate kinase family enzyme